MARYIVAVCTLTLLFLTLALAPPAAADGAHVNVVEQTITETGSVTGFPSHQNFDLRQPGRGALLYGIGGHEKSDKPCYLELHWWRENDPLHETFITRWHRDPCKLTMEAKDKEKVWLAKNAPERAIAGIKVCNSAKDNKRLKGIEITKAATITTAGTTHTSNFKVDGDFERPNCPKDGWDKPSACSDGQAAVGIKIYHDAEGATGLELICAAAFLDLPDLSVFALPPDPHAARRRSDISGVKGDGTMVVMIGTGVDLPNPPERYYGITEIEIREDSDKPCRVILYGGALDADKGPDTRKLAQDKLTGCDAGKAVDNLVKDNVVHVKVSQAPHHFVQGIKVCDSKRAGNDRIKGLGIQPALVQADDPPMEPKTKTHLGSPVSFGPKSDDWQPNCLYSGYVVRPWVYCTVPSIAVGVVMHHSNGEFVGIQLVCRDVTTGPYEALKEDGVGY